MGKREQSQLGEPQGSVVHGKGVIPVGPLFPMSLAVPGDHWRVFSHQILDIHPLHLFW